MFTDNKTNSSMFNSNLLNNKPQNTFTSNFQLPKLSNNTEVNSFKPASLYNNTQDSGSTNRINYSQVQSLTPFSNSNTNTSLDDFPLKSLNQIPIEVQRVLENLSNADVRSCHILTEIFNKLRLFSLENPVFLTFTYEVDMNPQSTALKRNQLEQQLQSLNPSIIEKYNMRKKANPDPAKYIITPIIGFDGLIQRCVLQNQYLIKINNALQDLNNKQQFLKSHMEVEIMKRIDSIRKRHQILQSSIISVLGTLEDCALKNSRPQVDIPFLRRLQSEINNLYDDFHQSSCSRHYLNQIKARLVEISEFLGINSSFDPYGENKVDRITHDIKDMNLLNEKKDNNLKKSKLSEITQCSISETTIQSIRSIIQKQESIIEPLKNELKEDLVKAKFLIQMFEDRNSPDEQDALFPLNLPTVKQSNDCTN